MARLAKRNTVRYVVSQIWKLCPSLDVVRVYATPVSLATVAAGVFVAAPDGFHPSQILSGSAGVLVGLSALPVPMIGASKFRIGPSSHRCNSALNVFTGLLASAQGQSRHAGLFLGDYGKRLASPAAHSPLMAVDESSALALDHVSLAAGVRDDVGGLSASTLAEHHDHCTSEAA